MTAVYPLHINTVLNSKKRRQAPPFAMQAPRRGTGYIVNGDTEPPVIFDVEFRFNRFEAIVFRLWFETVALRGSVEFSLPLRTEFGLLSHTCQFMPGSLLPVTERGTTWGYSAALLVRAQQVPSGYLPLATGLTTAYPDGLPGILQASKRRSQDACFVLPQAEVGYSEAEEAGRDRPVTWDIEFGFTTEQAQLFMVWFVEVLDRGRVGFQLPIRTEYGMVAHECRFLPDGLLSARQDGTAWIYTAAITARAEVIPPGVIEAAPVIIALDDWAVAAGYIDEAVSALMPEA